MRCQARGLLLAVLTVFCACSGGGSTTPTTMIPQANSPVDAPSGNMQSVQLGLQPMSATLPVVAQITGTLLFAAVRTPATILLSGSATAPAGVALESLRREQSGTLTVYEYVTIISPITTSLPSLPAMTLHFPTSTPIAGKSVYYGISDLNAQGGLVSFNTQGPGTIDGQTVSFAPVPTPITYEAGHKYTFVVYATGTAPVKVGATKIYVANYSKNIVATYSADGTQTTPTITTGLSGPNGIAVDAAGKIYVTNFNYKDATTYSADGTQTTPTIFAYLPGLSLSPLSDPYGIALDAAGNIYLLTLAPGDGGGASSVLTAYSPDGLWSTPAFLGHYGGGWSGVAIGANKIYILIGGGAVIKFNADGTTGTPPYIYPPPHSYAGEPQGIAVDAAGKIYVVTINPDKVTTYKADGTQTTPTITAGLNNPSGVAVDAAGKIYVLNYRNDSSGGKSIVTTYNPDGSQSTPTITTGLSGSSSIAVH